MMMMASFGACTATSGGASTADVKSVSKESDAVQRNAQAALSRAKELYESRRGSLKPNGQGRNFVTNEMAPYFHRGMSFDQAEALIKQMGGKVSPRGMNPYFGNSPLASVVAGDVTLESSFPSKVSLVVTLFPEEPGKYDVVDKVEAEISISTL
jgi:hypothetical protein